MSENKPSLAAPEVHLFRAKNAHNLPKYNYTTAKKRLSGRKSKAVLPILPEPKPEEWAKRGLPNPTRKRPDHCECCGSNPAELSNVGRQKGLALDHDHDTGLFRGWLCSRCNRGLGMFGDSYDGLRKAYEYLKRHYG